jgi:hypothetical protein
MRCSGHIEARITSIAVRRHMQIKKIIVTTLAISIPCGSLADVGLALLHCTGWNYESKSGIIFDIVLDTSYPGATSSSLGKEYATYCDETTCILRFPPESRKPTEQFVLFRLNGAYQHLVNSSMTVFSASRGPGEGCTATRQLF